MSKEYPWGKGTLNHINDRTNNSSSKSWTVPTGKIWEVYQIYVSFLTTATVGNRVLQVYFDDGATYERWASPRSGNIAANQEGTVRFSQWPISWGTTAANNPVESGTAPNVTIYGPLPTRATLVAGEKIVIKDTAAVDANADDMHVYIDYVEYDA